MFQFIKITFCQQRYNKFYYIVRIYKKNIFYMSYNDKITKLLFSNETLIFT